VELCGAPRSVRAAIAARHSGQRRQGETEEVPRVLRHLQTIRLGRLQMGPNVHHTMITEVPHDMNEQLQKLGLGPLFASPPKRSM
jgi:hypothetical protein